MSVLWGVLVGLSLVAGAVAAATLRLPSRVAAMLAAFGGGTLLAAVALELVPEADRAAGAGLTAGGLLAGMLVYVAADAWLSRNADTAMMRQAAHAAASGQSMKMPADPSEATRGKSIAVGLFVDGVPESVALGLTIAEGEIGVALLGGIVIGNVVEAYGASQAIIMGGRSRGYVIGLLAAIGIALAAATVLGAVVEVSPALIGFAQAVAAGAVLAVVSISIIPHAFAEVSRLAATATVLGFAAGYLLSV